MLELQHYLGHAGRHGARVRAFPGRAPTCRCGSSGSSLYGAQLAAYLGLPYAFASHFAPAMLEEAADTYRATFRPSRNGWTSPIS